jgi:hypothetical protein
VYYSLFMAVMMVLMSERVEKRLVVFPPLIFAVTAFVYMFRVSPPPPLRNAEGVGLYIGFFRSS